MSWLENIITNLIITTGDGKEYRPLWLNASKSVDYNIAEFNFPSVEGTLVKRGTPKGRRFNIEIYFQGENHLEIAEAFETSARDKRAWIISHPFYGRLTVQPLGLGYDNSKYNVTKITGVLAETITEDNPKSTVVPVDKIIEDKAALDTTSAESYENRVPAPSATDVNELSANTENLYTKGAKAVSASDSENYLNLYNTANSAIASATNDPLAAIRAVQAMINAPAEFAETVKTRINLLVDQFNKLRASVSTLLSKNSKALYENNGTAVVSSMAVASSTPLEGDYGNRNDVVEIIEILLDTYNEFVEDLDSLQSANGGSVTAFIPDSKTLMDLSNLLNFTVSNLFNVALNAKQERSYLVEEDTNLILLAHRFYGLKQNDETIDEIIRNNKIGINELLEIRKGRKIIYYV